MKHQTDPAEVVSTNGGDPACWAHLVCAECGAVETEGHRPGCRYEQADASGTDRATGS